MYKQIVAVLALVAVSHAGVITTGLGLAAPAIAVRAEPVDIHPQYSYSYGVQDPNTGDVKSQTETRDGDVVRGQYSLIDSDGTRRVVDYAADSINGFNAVVRKDPLAVATPAVVTKTIASPVIAAPAIAAPAIATRTIAAPSIATLASPLIASRTIATPGIATLAAPGGSIAVQDVSGRILLGGSPLAYNALNLGLAYH